MTARRWRAALVVLAAFSFGAAPAAAVTLPDIEDEVMCPTCKMPLDRSQSPQANDQRRFIRGLIADGNDKAEIKAALVAEYGEAVLADPDSDGFGLAAYVVPLLLLGVLGVGLATALPLWRRRDQSAASTGPHNAPDTLHAGSISAEGDARLNADLARYDS